MAGQLWRNSRRVVCTCLCVACPTGKPYFSGDRRRQGVWLTNKLDILKTSNDKTKAATMASRPTVNVRSASGGECMLIVSDFNEEQELMEYRLTMYRGLHVPPPPGRPDRPHQARCRRSGPQERREEQASALRRLREGWPPDLC